MSILAVDNLKTAQIKLEARVLPQDSNAEDGQTKIEVKVENETVWLSQSQMADLFQKTVPTINEHIKNVFLEGELAKNSVIRKFRITAADGKKYETNFYNLDVIISVGYRVKSHRGTQFRIWATKKLRDYIIKGFAMDDERLAEGKVHKTYFEEWEERIRRIRTSEANFYQKVRDVFATSADYNSQTDYAKLFYATVQNKFHVEQRVMYMKNWIKKLDDFLILNDKEILQNAGNVSHLAMEKKVREKLKKS